MLIVLVEGSKPIGVVDLAPTRWVTASNGFKNYDSVDIPISRRGIPTSFYVLDDEGIAISHGTLENLCSRQLDTGDWWTFPPGKLTFALDPLRGREAPLLSAKKLDLRDGDPRLLE